MSLCQALASWQLQKPRDIHCSTSFVVQASLAARSSRQHPNQQEISKMMKVRPQVVFLSFFTVGSCADVSALGVALQNNRPHSDAPCFKLCVLTALCYRYYFVSQLHPYACHETSVAWCEMCGVPDTDTWHGGYARGMHAGAALGSL